MGRGVKLKWLMVCVFDEIAGKCHFSNAAQPLNKALGFFLIGISEFGINLLFTVKSLCESEKNTNEMPCLWR